MWNPEGYVIEPHGAESYEISDDGTVWTFKLHDNIRFQTGYDPVGPRDGTLLTAADVKYSLEKIMGLIDGFVSARSGWMKEFVDIARDDHGLVVVDDRTIEIHMVQPFAGLANILTIGYSSIYPEGTTRDDLLMRPYGAGPWVLKEFQRGSVWTYERNRDYFNPSRPYLDVYQHVNIRGTEVTQSAFLTNQIDLHDGWPTPDNESLYEKLTADGKVRNQPYTAQQGGSTGCRPQGLNMNMYKPPFDNKELRQAVNLAIDREAYTQVVHYGNAIPHLFLETGGMGRTVEEISDMPGYRQPHDADLAEAQAIMDRLYPNGLDVEMKTRDSSTYMRQGEFLAGELRKIGINVTINIMNSAQLFPLAQAGNYELWNYYFCQTTGTPAELMGSYFITSGSRNWLGGYSNPDIDSGYLDMAGTMDPAERKAKAIALEDIVMDDLPIAPLPVHTSVYNIWDYIKDVPVTSTFYTMRKIENVWRDDS
ncbi:MAG: ABC transporter substrate-binding protein [Dehalococcoidia bacterium]